jgi:hypothetical protein
MLFGQQQISLLAKSSIIKAAFRAKRLCGGHSNGSINLLGAVDKTDQW